MTRIVAGAAGSMQLRVPTSGTRPTAERVREALFSSLEARGAVDGAAVLDLFAGSGALGLEAASRGASMVRLVDRDRRAADVARGNASTIRRALGDRCAIETVQASAESQAALPGEWDLVLIDPPYAFAEEAVDAIVASLVPALAPGGVVVVERDRRSGPVGWPDGVDALAERRYGDTTVALGVREG